ncbi:hypothetical protein G6011_01371 [Alternaria panax]|uniref:Uncharacterized protein n=1 Tax=Alternaria panax TaxID=48097 RepID=A0AAD4IKP4_9PLEO|nr:hypothetical protein G6011_01371 [Alternaria panax]
MPKTTTESSASALFRYYRQRFTDKSTFAVEKPFIFWTRMRVTGDNYSCDHLATENLLDKLADDDGSVDTDYTDTGSRPHVFKLCLGGSPSKNQKRISLSRLDVLNQMFDAYINRLLAHNLQTRLGLVTFSTKSSVSQKITHALERFRHSLNNINASGDTAIWDSMALAQDQLQSKNKAHSLPSDLFRNGIVVDSFCLGNEYENTGLKTISYLTGGYLFQPRILEEAMAICGMEPVLSLSKRPDRSPKGSAYHRNYLANPGLYTFRVSERIGEVEQVSRDKFLDRKQHPQLAESFVELGRFNRIRPANRTNNNTQLILIDTISIVVTLSYHWDEVQFKDEAQRHIEKHASKSREAWRDEIVG